METQNKVFKYLLFYSLSSYKDDENKVVEDDEGEETSSF